MSAGFTGLMVWEKCHGVALFGGDIATLESVVIGAVCIITALWGVCVCNTVIISGKENSISDLQARMAKEISVSERKTKEINEFIRYVVTLKTAVSNSELRHRILIKSLTREDNRQKWERFQTRVKAKAVAK